MAHLAPAFDQLQVMAQLVIMIHHHSLFQRKIFGQCVSVYAGTRFEEQRMLHMPQKHKATVPDSTLRMEMNALEEQADNAKACELQWKPLSWLGTIRTAHNCQ